MSRTSAEMQHFLDRKNPPVSDDWKPNHRKNKKPYGLILFTQGWRSTVWELVSWHATERARDDAVQNANKPRKYSPVVAMMKVDR